MAQRKDPAAKVTEFFETASVEIAQTVLGICKAIVARRQPAKPRTRGGKGPVTRIAGAADVTPQA